MPAETLLPDLRALELVALGAAVVAVLALLLLGVLAVRLRRMSRSVAVLTGGDATETFVQATNRQADAQEALRRELTRVREDVSTARADLSDALRHVAVVRYDAFGDMGGRLSFSAALLDDAGDGIVLTSINGRSETRTYAKGVTAGSSEHSLSPEEEQAIDRATRGGPPSTAGAAPTRRRGRLSRT